MSQISDITQYNAMSKVKKLTCFEQEVTDLLPETQNVVRPKGG